MRGEALERLAELAIVCEPFRAFEKPPIERVLVRDDFRGELGVKSRRIVHEIARMHFEKRREQLARRLG